MQQLNFLDLFSGIGGFRYGMEKAGNKCVGWCDIDKYARKSYENMYPHAKKEFHAGDIRSVSDSQWLNLAKKVGHIDVICGGFPCQTFSIAGRRKGFLDKTRGTLFFQIARIAKVVHPAYLFMENVKGLLNHNQGKTFSIILATLNEIGYDAEWHVLNSKYFGVPQNRERVYIIAHRRGTKTASVFTDNDNNFSKLSQHLSYYYNARKHHSYGTNDIIKTNSVSKTLRSDRQDNTIAYHPDFFHHGKHQSKNVYKTNGISPTVDATTYKHKIMIAKKNNNIQLLHQSRRELCRIYSRNGISPTISTMQGGDRQPKIGMPIKNELSQCTHSKKFAVPCLAPERMHKRQNGRKVKNDEGPEFTLNTIDRNGVGLMHHGQLVVRKLTPLECWRLQGYPDSLFYKAQQVCSNSQLYKQAGNSVSVPVIEYIAKRLKI